MVAALVAAAVLTPAAPLPNAHSHNDYWRPRPLLDALENGFCSVEADVFLVDGELRVGHDRKELRPGRTLESLYLEPLRRRTRATRGSVYGDGTPFILMVDIKADPEAVLDHLQRVLPRYRAMLDEVVDGRRTRRAVTIVLSGARPIATVAAKPRRFVFLDARPADLGWQPATLSSLASPGLSPSPDLMPMVSDSWSNHFRWTGQGPMPSVERARLRWMASRAKLEGRLLRFWALPHQESVWREVESAGVGLINADDLPRLANWLRRTREGSR